MKPELTQKEIADIFDDGEIVVSFRTAYCAQHLAGPGYYLRELKRTRGTPYTGKGRFHVISIDKFDSMERGDA